MEKKNASSPFLRRGQLQIYLLVSSLADDHARLALYQRLLLRRLRRDPSLVHPLILHHAQNVPGRIPVDVPSLEPSTRLLHLTRSIRRPFDERRPRMQHPSVVEDDQVALLHESCEPKVGSVEVLVERGHRLEGCQGQPGGEGRLKGRTPVDVLDGRHCPVLGERGRRRDELDDGVRVEVVMRVVLVVVRDRFGCQELEGLRVGLEQALGRKERVDKVGFAARDDLVAEAVEELDLRWVLEVPSRKSRQKGQRLSVCVIGQPKQSGETYKRSMCKPKSTLVYATLRPCDPSALTSHV